MTHKDNAIVFFFDDSYFDYFKACLHSLEVNYASHPTLLAVYQGRSAAVHRFLKRFAVKQIEPDQPDYTAFVRKGPVDNSIVFRRFALWTDQFDQFDKLLHLDVDTLVLGSLSELFHYGDFFAVSNNEDDPGVKIFDDCYVHDEGLLWNLRQDGLEYPNCMEDMVNAGVFVIPRHYRTRAETDTIQDLARRYGPYFAYADQSLLSLWCKLRNIEHSQRLEYNYQSPFFNGAGSNYRFEDIRLLHFSNYKPDTPGFIEWDRLEGWRERLRDLYIHYRDM